MAVFNDQFKTILIPVDNSEHSNLAIDAGISLARKFNSTLIGNHVYAARLHDQRFTQMESGLPTEYQEPEELERQRKIHDSLITKGLQIISDSYLDRFEDMCKRAGVVFQRKTMEGKNYARIVKDINESRYNLVIMGLLGLGALERSVIGSVTSRVVRRSNSDILIVKRKESWDRKIIVAVDGSPQSFAAVKRCAALAKAFNCTLEAVAVFDPQFHIVAFRSIAGVLSEEAGKIFKFKEQEKLHDEIIDKGLEKIYQGHLDNAKKAAKEEGLDINTVLMSGRPFDKVLEYIERENPSLIAVGKVGYHTDNGLDLGSVTENLLIQSSCNLLIAAQRYNPPIPPLVKGGEGGGKELPWTKEALARMERIPPFVRNMAKKAIIGYAVEKGYKEITEDVLQEAREKMGM
ncbi:MAG: universal stress protein [Nitrospinae bacterium]|nr:universal stress protein [Nitrospinota bacterium]